MRSRIIAMVAACLLAIGFGSFLTANPAFAADRTQYCYGPYCLNAWNGGPEVNVYSPGVNNNSFDAFFSEGTGYWNIQFLGGGRYNEDCIGDLGNNSHDARAGLYSDCAAGNVAWGANFTAETQNCSSGDIAFHDNHWGGWLAPAGLGDGDAFYLNNPDEYCFTGSSF